MIQENQELQFNGQIIEIKELINQMGTIKLYQGNLKTIEQNILIIEVDKNFQIKEQLKLLVYDIDLIEFYKEKLQNVFLKTSNDQIIKLNQYQIYSWEDYFKLQEFKFLPIQSKHKLFLKYCKKQIYQQTFDLCIFQQNQLGCVQIKSLSQRLFRINDWINQLDIDFNQEYSQIEIQQTKNFGLVYFRMLTDIDVEQLNLMSLDQRIQLIQDSPLYEWQKLMIINFLNLKFDQQFTKQQKHLITLIKQDYFDVDIDIQKAELNLQKINDQINSGQKNNQWIDIIFQYLLQQSQIQAILNYLYYHINKEKSNHKIFQEYVKVNKFNSEFYNNLINTIKTQNDQNVNMLKLQLNELNNQYHQLHLNFQNNFFENLIIIHKKLQLKLDKFYGPSQFLGQFGALKIGFFSKLQNQNKSQIEKLQQQMKNQIQFNSILNFNESLDNFQKNSGIIKAEYQSYQTQLVNCLIQIQQLLETNLILIQKEFQKINLKYLMIILDESSQFSLVQSLLEKQQYIKETLDELLKQKLNFIYKKNGKKIDIMKTSEQFEESECIIRGFHQIIEEFHGELIQFEEENSPEIFNNVNLLRIYNQEKLQELQEEFNSHIQSIKFLMNELFKNMKIVDNQMLNQFQNRIEEVAKKQNQRFCIIKELLQQSQIQRLYQNNVSKKIEEERKIINIYIFKELQMLIELYNSNINGENQEQNKQMIDIEFMILKTLYNVVQYHLMKEKQNIKQKFQNIEIAFSEQKALIKQIEILSQENYEIILYQENRNMKGKKVFNNFLKKIKESFEEKKKSFQEFSNFLKEKKAEINLKQDEERLCFLIEQYESEISKDFQEIQNQNNNEKTGQEKQVEYEQLRNKLQYICQEILIKGKQICLDAQGYYQQLILIILSKFYHMKRYYQRLIQFNDATKNKQIKQEDIELINSQKDEFIQLESKVDYYRNVIFQNHCQKVYIENLHDELDDLDKQIEQKKTYFQFVIQYRNESNLKQYIKQKITVDQIQKFSNYLEFSKLLPFQLILQNSI
ncbi:unnamed protein product [Paramecium sonneborni]|uniref:Uncharacterized protein n=1 Tax=Paramecium sonneborni TaxID=65129 RepID=A0A8S1NU80_9CILI|nr:unnamed protein product [Paramecium sonneborni]